MLFLLYLIVKVAARLLALGRSNGSSKDLEILVLQHQVRILQRKAGRPRLGPLDRAVMAAASRILPRERWVSFIVTPKTILRWHRELVRRKWTYGRRGNPGRPPIDPEVRELILRLARENPRWGGRAYPGRAPQVGHPGGGHDDPDAPKKGGPRSRPQANRTHLVGVPEGPSEGDHRVRLLLRGDDPAQDPLRPDVHRVADEARLRHGLDGPSRLGLGHPAGEEPVHRRRRPRAARSVPDPRPGLEVLRLLRRGLPLGRDRGDPQPDPSAECERLRRALGPHRPSGVSGLDADPRAPAPGPGAPDLRGALQRPSRASVARTRCAAGPLRGSVTDPPSGGPPARRTRRADPRVPRDGGMTNQSFGPLRVAPADGSRPGGLPHRALAQVRAVPAVRRGVGHGIVLPAPLLRRRSPLGE